MDFQPFWTSAWASAINISNYLQKHAVPATVQSSDYRSTAFCQTFRCVGTSRLPPFSCAPACRLLLPPPSSVSPCPLRTENRKAGTKANESGQTAASFRSGPFTALTNTNLHHYIMLHYNTVALSGLEGDTDQQEKEKKVARIEWTVTDITPSQHSQAWLHEVHKSFRWEHKLHILSLAPRPNYVLFFTFSDLIKRAFLYILVSPCRNYK